MKQKQRFFILVLLVGTAAFSACKKDGKGNPSKTKTQLLTQKDWVQTAGRMCIREIPIGMKERFHILSQ